MVGMLREQRRLRVSLGKESSSRGWAEAQGQVPHAFISTPACLWNTLLLGEKLIFFDDLMAKFRGKLALTLALGIDKHEMLSQQQRNERISTKKCWGKEM